MKKLILSVAMLSGSAAWAQQATPDFEYHGYMRSGFGFSRGGTDQQCFGAPGASGKYRLGNECDTYIEAQLVKYSLLGKSTTEPYFKTYFRVAATSNGDRDWEPTTTEVKSTDASGKPVLGSAFTLALREAWVEGVNVLGTGRPWVGKRFYRRQDIHMLDYYVIDDSGPGAGIEGIDVGFAQLHVAMNRNVPNDDDGPAQTNGDVRLSDINVGAGKLEVVGIYGAAGDRGHATGDSSWEQIAGAQGAVVHSLDVLGGFNRVTLQYGKGIFGADGASRNSRLHDFGGFGSQEIAKGQTAERKARKDSSSLFVSEELVTQVAPAFSSGFVLLYENSDFGGYKDGKTGKEVPNKSELSAGIRPVAHITDTTAVALEYGYTDVKKAYDVGSNKYEDAVLHKITLAPEVTARGFWARPQLRLFATYASWNDESKGHIGGDVYAKDKNGFSTGAQLEAWW